MSSPSPKRPRHDISSSIQNPNSQSQLDSPLVPTVPCFNQSHADSIISSLLSFPGSSSISIASSFDRVLDKTLASVSDDDSVQDRLVDRTLELASFLIASTKRCFRKRASHNSYSWLLPPELTIKVFSMLDTKSLMQAAACCTMFNKCATDRLCYSNIDLTTSAAEHVDNGLVSTMIHRAGKELRSLKIGHVVRPDGSAFTPSLLTGSCLSPLSSNHGFLGSRLRCLRLYNFRLLDFKVLCDVLSVCSNITDLTIVGVYNLSKELFESLAKKCRLIETLFLEACDVNGFALSSNMSRNLAEGSRKLKYINLSRTATLKGRFLRDLGRSCKDGPLRTLILRNCPSLEEKEVLEFCNSLLDGHFKSIKYIDVSNKRGLVTHGRKRSKKPNFPLEKLKEERPGVTFVADFPSTSSRVCNETEEEELKLIEMMGAKDDGDSEEDFVGDYGLEENDMDEEEDFVDYNLELLDDDGVGLFDDMDLEEFDFDFVIG